MFLAQYALYITEYRTKVTRVFAAFLASVVRVVMIAILLTVFGIIDPVGIVGQYTQNASTLDMVRMVSKVLVHPSTLTICIIFINLLILGTVYYQMFKKINIKILYATIALTFSVNLLIDGVIMRGIREGDSCRVFAERILKVGIRESLQNRYTLERRTQTVSTPYGAVRQKISSGYGVQRQKAEYEDIAAIAREQGLSIAHVREILK